MKETNTAILGAVLGFPEPILGVQILGNGWASTFSDPTLPTVFVAVAHEHARFHKKNTSFVAKLT